MTEEVPLLLKILAMLLVITGPVTFLVVSGIAIFSTQALSQRRWQQIVGVLVTVGIYAILILTPVAWRWAPWALIG